MVDFIVIVAPKVFCCQKVKTTQSIDCYFIYFKDGDEPIEDTQNASSKPESIECNGGPSRSTSCSPFHALRAEISGSMDKERQLERAGDDQVMQSPEKQRAMEIDKANMPEEGKFKDDDENTTESPKILESETDCKWHSGLWEQICYP